MQTCRHHLRYLAAAVGLAAFGATPGILAAEIEEIVVQARAEEKSVRDIPVALTAVGEERMNNFGIESFTDLEAITPQLSIRRAGNGNGATIGIRGIGSTTTSIGIEQSVALMIDGVYFPQGRAINEGLLDVSQVAVLKGPQALYFGKNATAGVVSVMTNNPGDEFEASIRINNEFKSDDLTLEGMISVPINDKIGVRLVVQKSKMDEGWIENSGVDEPAAYQTTDAATFAQQTYFNPAAESNWPQEESTYVRLTLAGDLSDTFDYNIKGSYAKFEQGTPSGALEMFSCRAMNGIAHTSATVAPQPAGRQTPLREPIALPNVDCAPDGGRGWNNVPPEIARTNALLSQFGGEDGDLYESYSITGNFNWAFDNYDLNLILNYHEQEAEWVGDQDASGVTSIFAGEKNDFDNLSAEFRMVTRLDQPVNFVLGGYFQKTERYFNQVVNFAGARNTAAAANDEYTAYDKISETDGETQSIYGEVIWDIADRWQMTAGVRYIDETKDSYFIQPYVNPFFLGLFTVYDPANPATRAVADQSFDDVIPEMTLRWETTDDLTLYAAYKEGFKSGGFSNSAILSNLSPNGFNDFIFEPEEVKGGEVGAKAAVLDSSMLLTFEVFFYDFEDLQVDYFNSAQFAYVTENAGGSETKGAELQVEWLTPIEGLYLSGSISYLSSTFTEFESFCSTGQTLAQGCVLPPPPASETAARQSLDGNDRPGAPEWSGFVALNYERPLGENLLFGITANAQFRSEQGLVAQDATATADSYQTYDANIRVGAADGKWQLALIGKNLSDEYEFRFGGNVPGTGGNTGTAEGFPSDLQGVAIRPRQVELEFTYNF
ncbi:MAG: TonB-dependent receptor [Gammaproteobacteria bacterium]|nr:TonB-dependent receptor [Gammaproteobacteria bacterium]MBT4492245.1 TonB-dependent receptor [Gammaproteobacteria bacterium]